MCCCVSVCCTGKGVQCVVVCQCVVQVKEHCVLLCVSDGQVLVVLTHCFWRLVEQRTDTSGPMARLNWLLELLGHTRNVITGVMPLTSPSQTLRNVSRGRQTLGFRSHP